MLTSFSAAIGISRAINYVRERRRNAPRSRSWGRRLAYRTTRRNELRVHHSVPGLAIGLLTGGAAILTRGDDRAFWLSLPFGAGTGLGFDEVALLVERDNPYWGSETIALGQAAAAAAGATVVAAHFHLRGRQELERDSHTQTNATQEGASMGFEIPKDKVIEFLRERGQHDKAARAEQELPEKVDHEQHSDLLSKHGIDPQELIGKIGL